MCWASARILAVITPAAIELLPLLLATRQELLETDTGLGHLEILHAALVRGDAGRQRFGEPWAC